MIAKRLHIIVDMQSNKRYNQLEWNIRVEAVRQRLKRIRAKIRHFFPKNEGDISK